MNLQSERSGNQQLRDGHDLQPDIVSRTLASAGGTDDAETVIGTSGRDTCSGGGGNDDVEGAGGNDVLDGGPGDDRTSAASATTA